MVLGLSSEAEAAIDKALKVQQDLDEKRGAYAEKLRALRGASISQSPLKKRNKEIKNKIGGYTQRNSGHYVWQLILKVL